MPPRLFTALVAGLLAVGLAGSAPAQVSESEQVRKTTTVPESEVRATIERLGNSLNVPGFAVAIFDANGVVFRQTTGQVDASSQFFLGSLTKALTATLVMRLVDRTTIELDAPARKFLSWDLPRQIRVADLLHHRTGIGRPAGYASWNGDPETLARHVEALDLAAGPHEFEYSNLNYEIVGRLIEEVTESSYRAALRSDLLEPLGMDQTHAPASPSDVQGLARGHQYAFGFPVQREEHPYYEWEIPSRFVTSSLSDLVRFGRLHLGDGQIDRDRLLEASHVRPSHSEAEGKKTGHVMGWFAEEHSGHRILRHEGRTSSHHASMALVPEQGIGVVVLGNVNSYGAGAAGMLAKNLALTTAGESAEALTNFEFVLRLALGVTLLSVLLLLAIRFTGWVRRGLHVRLPPGALWRILPAFGLATGVVLAAPWYFGVPFFAIVAIQPDLAAGLVGVPAAGALSVLLGEWSRAAEIEASDEAV